MGHIYYPRPETLNRWHSFDAHFQHGAGSSSLLLLPIKEANTSIITICNQCPLWLPRMQDIKLLTLHWRSLSGWGRERLSRYFDHNGGRSTQKEHCHTIFNILRLTVGYLNATINITTGIAKAEIGPNGSSQTRRSLRVDGYGAGYGLPKSSGPDHWTVLDQNLTVSPVQTLIAGGLPGSGANTTHDYRLTPECGFSFRRDSLHNRPQ